MIETHTMNTFQGEIDFTPKRHRENNAESQRYADANIEHFSEQCRKVYGYLLNHREINLKTAINELDVWDLRRRVKDLKDKHGITIYSKRMSGGFKNYSLKEYK